MSKGLLVSNKHKQQLYYSHFKSNDSDKKQFFKDYSNKLNKLKLKAKRNYYFEQLKENGSNPKKFWNIIDSFLHSNHDSQSFPGKLLFDNHEIDVISDIAESFNVHFSEVGVNIASNLPNNPATAVKKFLGNRIVTSVFLKPVTHSEISSIIHGLNVNKAGGFDEISTYFY